MNENRSHQQPYRGGWGRDGGGGRRHDGGGSPSQRGFGSGGSNPRFREQHDVNGRSYNHDNHSSHQESGLWNQSNNSMAVQQPPPMGGHTEHTDQPMLEIQLNHGPLSDPPPDQENNNNNPTTLIPMKDWKQLGFREKMYFLLPLEQAVLKSMIVHFDYPPDFLNRCKLAVEETLSDLPRMLQHRHHEEAHESDDDDSSNDSPIPNMVNISQRGAGNTTDQYAPFIKALPDCVGLFFGFHVSPVRASQFKSCYCPCNKKMETWRKLFGLTNVTMCTTSKGSDKPYTDLGLVAHLEQKANGCIYHDLVLKFIRALYSNFWNSSTNHKALYKMNDKAYKRAESLQNQREIDKLKELEEKVDEQMRQKAELERQLSEMKEVSDSCRVI